MNRTIKLIVGCILLFFYLYYINTIQDVHSHAHNVNTDDLCIPPGRYASEVGLSSDRKARGCKDTDALPAFTMKISLVLPRGDGSGFTINLLPFGGNFDCSIALTLLTTRHSSTLTHLDLKWQQHTNKNVYLIKFKSPDRLTFPKV